jgi:hypothetical protein
MTLMLLMLMSFCFLLLLLLLLFSHCCLYFLLGITLVLHLFYFACAGVVARMLDAGCAFSPSFPVAPRVAVGSFLNKPR